MKRHRSEYPASMQEIGDLLELWDEAGFLIYWPGGMSPFTGLGILASYGSRTPPPDSKPGPSKGQTYDRIYFDEACPRTPPPDSDHDR